uniref:Sirohydrochlorin cobaltochelatase n=1 Tax=Candidatus Kentrum sp. MB TaxID=2138164 RepID=A0A450XFQ4_9GAMM|nr:MAG: sirohydrochlorin cobaltochelatase [Candidatus Kentron sp. MB]VFK32935.1 MAG: sirohydrochlorin cobaltochelatase [Candidatus Kentron sp. MB]
MSEKGNRKDTILLVGHGSRGPDGNRETEEFAEQWRARRPDLDIRLCYIELANVLLDEGLDDATFDAERVIVVPLIINAAGHVKTEIPEEIAKARVRNPDVEFIYVPHLGACDPILAILKRRLHQTMRDLDMPDPKTTGIILLSRGSSDPMANGDVAQMARWLFEASEHELVDIAFTGITHPRLERVVQRQARLGMMQMVILPYYLFTGRLIERIKKQVKNLRRQYPGIRFARGEHIGFEDEIFQLLEQRVHDAGKPEAWMPCDGCKKADRE